MVWIVSGDDASDSSQKELAAEALQLCKSDVMSQAPVMNIIYTEIR